MLITFIRKLIFFDVNTFNETFFIFKNLFDKFDEFEQKKIFFRKEMLFFYSIINFFEKIKSFFCLKIFFEKKISIF